MIHETNFKGLPGCLSSLMTEHRWCGWRWEARTDKHGEIKRTKPPRQANGALARNDDPSTWATFDMIARSARKFEGPGLQLLGLAEFGALDLDNVRDSETGALLPWAEEVARWHSYCEITPSGTGLRVLGRVSPTHPSMHGKKAHPGGGEVEFYVNMNTGRYITVSGQRLPDAPDELRPIDDLIAKIRVDIETGERDANRGTKEEQGRSGFTFNDGSQIRDFGDLPNELQVRIAHGWTGDKSVDFQAAVNGLFVRVSFETALRFFEMHPEGPASKYAGRLEQELRRSWEKAAATSTSQGCKGGERGKPHRDEGIPPQDGPIPLFPEIEAAAPYPIEALGPLLAPAARAIARKIKVPLSLAAQSVLGVGALAAQTHADVLMPFGQTRPLSLSLFSIQDSGDRKSSADREAMWPIKKFERSLAEKYDTEHEQWTYEHAAWAAEKRKIEGDKNLDFSSRKTALATLGHEPPKPLAPWLVAGDVTAEGLVKAMINAPASLGLFTAEGGVITGGHGMAQENKVRTAANFSLMWDGEPIKRLRSLDGTTIIPGRRVSMHLLIQADAASEFLSDATLRDQGLLSRILVSAGESIAGTRFYEDPRAEDEAAIKAYGARVLKVLGTPWPLADGTRNELEPRSLPFSAAAKALWIKFFDHVEVQCGKNAPLAQVKDFAAKACEHAARIAGILTIVEDVSAPEIGSKAMRNALTLTDFYLGEVVRLQRASRTDPALLTAQRLLDWMRDRAKDGDRIAFRDVIQCGPSATRTKAAADAAIKKLIEHGWVRQVSSRPRLFEVMRSEAV